MQRFVEQQHIGFSDKRFAEIDRLSFLSKNLYNSALYTVRQHYFTTKKYLNYNAVQKLFQNNNNENYRVLPAKVAQQTLMLVHRNFTAFFKALKTYKVKPELFKGKPAPPGYMHVLKGRAPITYTSQAMSCGENSVKLSGTDVTIYTPKNVKQITITRKPAGYSVNIVYEAVASPKINVRPDPNKVASIDPGVTNLITLAFNDGSSPIIISGGPLKSTNHYYHKKLAKYKAEQKQHTKNKPTEKHNRIKEQFTTKKIERLCKKHNSKVKDYLHKVSRYVINLLASNGVSQLVIGHNPYQKQEINIGKANNQNTVSIPYYQLIQMLTYKGLGESIKVIQITEEYTSKCSFLDLEPIHKHAKYKGRRIKRGLFRSSQKRLINADVNGAYNIMRKAIPESISGYAVDSYGIQGVRVRPVKVKVVTGCRANCSADSLGVTLQKSKVVNKRQ